MIESKRYFLQIAYDGTNYSGWQMQPNKVSVQSTIDEALSTIFNEPLAHCTGCGRTDSGVHASDFYLHFEASNPIPENFVYRINKYLATDITVKRIFECDRHSRFDATYRAYDFHIHFDKNPFKHRFSFFFPYKPLDIPKMQRVAASLVNYKDFKPFEKSKSSSKTSICQMYECALFYDEQTQSLRLHLAANRFLRGMVRRITGAVLMVGVGKISESTFKEVMDTTGAFSLNVSVPPNGLFLSEVRYEDSCLYRV